MIRRRSASSARPAASTRGGRVSGARVSPPMVPAGGRAPQDARGGGVCHNAAWLTEPDVNRPDRQRHQRQHALGAAPAHDSHGIPRLRQGTVARRDTAATRSRIQQARRPKRHQRQELQQRCVFDVLRARRHRTRRSHGHHPRQGAQPGGTGKPAHAPPEPIPPLRGARARARHAQRGEATRYDND